MRTGQVAEIECRARFMESLTDLSDYSEPRSSGTCMLDGGLTGLGRLKGAAAAMK